MNEFSTPFVRNNKLGYCLTTLEIALNHIVNLTKEDFIVTEEIDRFTESRGSILSMGKRSLT